ncbi:MAG TPA: autotransporter-associated beta strand repeat-containing protein, partial [Verrucomicrobiae bacterium]|nr:autotransporter-associated beta strand repeat-containing protein [Verrucomicrobiae bacterium]
MKTYLNRVWTLAIPTLLAALSTAPAADRTWTGGGGNDFWSTPANWGGTGPTAGDSLLFGGSVRTSPNNDFPGGTSFGGITFLNPAGAFTLRGNGISLGGNITDNQPLVPQVIQFPIALTLSPTIDVAADGLLTLGGIVSGAGNGIAKSGAGQLTLSGANTFSGQVQILGGTLAVGSDGNLGHAPGSPTAARVRINTGALRATSTFTLNANRGIELGPAGGAINVNSGSTLSYGGVVAGGSGGLTKGAFGGLTLSGANTYIGPTVIENGTLTLDFAAASAPANNIISSSSALTLGGGTAGLGAASFDALVMNGKASTANSQTFNGATITIGPAIIRANSASGGSANMNLGALTGQPGGTLVVVPPTANGGVGAISTTTANTHGILGGWATVGSGTVFNNITMGTEWATIDGSGNVV